MVGINCSPSPDKDRVNISENLDEPAASLVSPVVKPLEDIVSNFLTGGHSLLPSRDQPH